MCFVSSKQAEKSQHIYNSKPTSKQMGMNDTNGQISLNDPRFAFLTKTPLPRTHKHYDAVAHVIEKLVNAAKYNPSIAFALDAFSEYRIEVLTWIYGIKEASVKMTVNSSKPAFALSTVVFEEFNIIQEILDSNHERTMQTFETAAQHLLKSGGNQQHQFTEHLLKLLQNKLLAYEMTVEKAQNILRSTLSFLSFL